MTRLTDIVIEDTRWEAAGLEALAESAASNALRHLQLDPSQFEIAILACDDARIAMLNADFRGKPAATNVLSWPDVDLAADEEGAIPACPTIESHGEPSFLGDIAIAFDTCEREAADAGTPFHDHVTHLIIHAVLHLLGYDHVRDRDATLMEGLETEILGKMGIKDPY